MKLEWDQNDLTKYSFKMSKNSEESLGAKGGMAYAYKLRVKCKNAYGFYVITNEFRVLQNENPCLSDIQAQTVDNNNFKTEFNRDDPFKIHRFNIVQNDAVNCPIRDCKLQ